MRILLKRVVISGGTLLTAAASLVAQNNEQIVLKNFKVSPARYPAPNERQMKSLLEGGAARQEGAGRYYITQGKLTTFKTNGLSDMVISTPECWYDDALKQLRSASALTLRAADGRYSISGTGFLWRQTNSALIISNDVKTVVHPELLRLRAGAPNTNVALPGAGIRIDSDRFEYAGDTGLGIYSGNVRVAGTNLALASDRLVLEIPLEEKQIQTVTAENHVRLRYDTIEAFGERAAYVVHTGLLNVTGEPAWQMEGRKGHADTLTLDYTNRIFTANGNAYLKLWGPGVGGLKLFGSDTGKQDTNRTLEVNCASYELRTNHASFRHQVRAADNTGAKLTCGDLALDFTGTNELQRMEAIDEVVFERGTRRFSGASALYTEASGKLRLEGAPQWADGDRKGHGDHIEFDVADGSMLVQSNAFMELPGSELGAAASKNIKPGVSSNLSVATNAPAQVRCAWYEIAREQIRFNGDVRISHPQFKWTCERLEVESPGGVANHMVAEPAVAFELVDAKGQQLFGFGDKAVYSRTIVAGRTNSLLELTGSPAWLQTTNGMRVENRVLVLDVANSTFVVPPGGYRILGPTNQAARIADLRMPQTSRKGRGRK